MAGAGNAVGGVRFGVLLDRGHGPLVLLVEAGDDLWPERAEGNGHVDVKDQPARHGGAGLVRLERVVDVHIYGGPQLADPDGVVKIDRPWGLEAGDDAPPVLALLVWFAVVVAASELDGIRLYIGGAGKLLSTQAASDHSSAYPIGG